MNPGDYPIGSVENRAAARALLERRQKEGPCGCAYVVRVEGSDVEVSAEPIVKCERHAAIPLSIVEVERDRSAIRAQFPAKEGWPSRLYLGLFSGVVGGN